jgi:hypothetical protein
MWMKARLHEEGEKRLWENKFSKTFTALSNRKAFFNHAQ